MDIRISSTKNVDGEFYFGGDKSLSHRIVLLSVLLKKEIIISNLSECEDVKTSLKIVEKLGVKIRKEGNKLTYLDGRGIKSQSPQTEPIELYCGNSGTTCRLLCGVLACLQGNYILTGDNSLSNRPMERVVEPLRRMGLDISCKNEKTLPIIIRSTGKTNSIVFENKTNSAQVKSAIELASLAAEKDSTIIESTPGRDHTGRLLNFIKQSKNDNYTFNIPGDTSSAAYFAGAAAIFKGSKICLKNILLNPYRIGFFEAIKSMGAFVELDIKENDWEPYGDVIVRGSSLKGISLTASHIPSIIDEIPLLGVIMCLADGKSMVTGAEELRKKESDRISYLIKGLKQLNVICTELQNGFEITGSFDDNVQAIIDSGEDHRIAMSFSLLGLKSKKGLTISNKECVNISFPDFFEKLMKIS